MRPLPLGPSRTRPCLGVPRRNAPRRPPRPAPARTCHATITPSLVLLGRTCTVALPSRVPDRREHDKNHWRGRCRAGVRRGTNVQFRPERASTLLQFMPSSSHTAPVFFRKKSSHTIRHEMRPTTPQRRDTSGAVPPAGALRAPGPVAGLLRPGRPTQGCRAPSPGSYLSPPWHRDS